LAFTDFKANHRVLTTCHYLFLAHLCMVTVYISKAAGNSARFIGRTLMALERSDVGKKIVIWRDWA
jgi:hypothetical protein